MNNGKLTGAVYVDFSKAFDTIDHSVLLQIQKFWWFNSYLFNKNNYVCVGQNISSPGPVYYAGPQELT